MTDTAIAHPFPMPGDKLAGRTVIASTWYRDLTDNDREYVVDDGPDAIALVLLLNREAPYFTVAHVGLSPGADRGRILESEDHYNIVHAVEDGYTPWGGDV